MDCIFCKIAEGEIPSHAVWEDAHYLAFLDINPMQPGHTLVIPKHHDPNLFEVSDKDYQNTLAAAKEVRRKLKAVTGAKRIGMMVMGLEVDHLHIHLVPINEPGDMNPTQTLSPTQEELKEMAQRIREQA